MSNCSEADGLAVIAHFADNAVFRLVLASHNAHSVYVRVPVCAGALEAVHTPDVIACGGIVDFRAASAADEKHRELVPAETAVAVGIVFCKINVFRRRLESGNSCRAYRSGLTADCTGVLHIERYVDNAVIFLAVGFLGGSPPEIVLRHFLEIVFHCVAFVAEERLRPIGFLRMSPLLLVCVRCFYRCVFAFLIGIFSVAVGVETDD